MSVWGSISIILLALHGRTEAASPVDRSWADRTGLDPRFLAVAEEALGGEKPVFGAIITCRNVSNSDSGTATASLIELRESVRARRGDGEGGGSGSEEEDEAELSPVADNGCIDGKYEKELWTEPKPPEDAKFVVSANYTKPKKPGKWGSAKIFYHDKALKTDQIGRVAGMLEAMLGKDDMGPIISEAPRPNLFEKIKALASVIAVKVLAIPMVRRRVGGGRAGIVWLSRPPAHPPPPHPIPPAYHQSTLPGAEGRFFQALLIKIAQLEGIHAALKAQGQDADKLSVRPRPHKPPLLACSNGSLPACPGDASQGQRHGAAAQGARRPRPRHLVSASW